MKTSSRTLTIGVLAAAAGVNVETIRFYQRKGLLPQPVRAYGTIRRYGDGDVARVRFMKSAQRLGFSLDEVAGLLTLEDGTHCDDARRLAEQKLDDVRSKLDDLRRIESALARLVERCSASRGAISCPLIGELHADGQRRARSPRRVFTPQTGRQRPPPRQP